MPSIYLALGITWTTPSMMGARQEGSQGHGTATLLAWDTGQSPTNPSHC